MIIVPLVWSDSKAWNWKSEVSCPDVGIATCLMADIEYPKILKIFIHLTIFMLPT